MTIKTQILSTILLLSLVLSLIFYSYRWIFSYQFDYSLAADKVGHSQWKIPQSSRVISDDELYPFVGYELVSGKKFILLNAEVPPFAKSLYGVAIVVTHNPYIASVVLFFLAIAVFYFLTKELGFTTRLTLLATLVLIENQLFFSQLGQTMLDLPQMVLVLTNLLFLLRVIRDPSKIKVGDLSLAGISLGLFAASKFPLFAVLLLGIEVAWLIYQYKNWRVLILPVVVGATYLGTYAIFAIGDSTLLELLHVQKWMVNFYAIGKIEPEPFETVLKLLSGDLVLQSKTSLTALANEWSIWWPIGIISCIWALVSKQTTRQVRLLSLIACLLMFALAVSPFENRYFLIVLPIAILVFFSIIKNSRQTRLLWTGLTAFFVLGLVQAIVFLITLPYTRMHFAIESWENANYQDFHAHLVPDSANTREVLAQSLRELDQNQHIIARTLSWKEPDLQQLLHWQYILQAVSTSTQANGKVQTTVTPITIQNMQGKHEIVWSKGLLPQLSGEECLQYPIDTTTRYTYLTIDKSQPDLEALIEPLSQATNQAKIDLRNAIFVRQSGQEVAVVHLATPTPEQEEQLAVLPGVTIHTITDQEIRDSVCASLPSR